MPLRSAPGNQKVLVATNLTSANQEISTALVKCDGALQVTFRVRIAGGAGALATNPLALIVQVTPESASEIGGFAANPFFRSVGVNPTAELDVLSGSGGAVARCVNVVNTISGNFAAAAVPIGIYAVGIRLKKDATANAVNGLEVDGIAWIID